MKIKLSIELTLDENIWGTEPEDKEWLINLLRDPKELFLHCNEIGDNVGYVSKVFSAEYIEPCKTNKCD